jgi:hypothetical protein
MGCYTVVTLEGRAMRVVDEEGGLVEGLIASSLGVGVVVAYD